MESYHTEGFDGGDENGVHRTGVPRTPEARLSPEAVMCVRDAALTLVVAGEDADPMQLFAACDELRRAPTPGKLCVVRGLRTPFAAFQHAFPAGAWGLECLSFGTSRVERTHAVLDHHEGCVRATTLSVCEQAQRIALGRLAIPTEMQESLQAGHAYAVTGWPPDHDALLAAWTLTEGVRSPEGLSALTDVFALEGKVDRAAGAYVPRDAREWEMMKTVKWITLPFVEARRRTDWDLTMLSAHDLHAMTKECFARARAAAQGKGGRCPIQTDYVIKWEGGRGWLLLDEEGEHGGSEARVGLLRDVQAGERNLGAFLSFLGCVAGKQNVHRYSAVNIVPGYFPLELFLDSLNAFESLPQAMREKKMLCEQYEISARIPEPHRIVVWGGGDGVIGGRSSFEPAQLVARVRYLDKAYRRDIDDEEWDMPDIHATLQHAEHALWKRLYLARRASKEVCV